MSLAELLPIVRTLPKQEQMQLMHILVEELGKGTPESTHLPPEFFGPGPFEVFSPDPCPDAAAALLRFLESNKISPE